MSEADLAALTVTPSASLRDALGAIDAGRNGVCLVVEGGRLRGLLTDGDARRAILTGTGLDEPALGVATTAPTVVDPDTPRANILDVMRARRLDVVPIVDASGTLRGLHTLSDMVGVRLLPNVAVIMAGGRGTRLGPLTRSTPKPLLEVAGRPIIEWAILELVGSGIRTIHVSVGHLGDLIVDHLGDGRALGADIAYLRDDPDLPLGTAGPLGVLADRLPDLAEAVVVMNGDIMARLDVVDLLAVHRRTDAVLTVGSRPYTHRIPFGVLDVDGGRVTGISEKPAVEVQVGAGVYAVSPRALALVPRGVASDMPDLVQRCLDDGLPVGNWPIRDQWIDVGTPGDLTRARSGE